MSYQLIPGLAQDEWSRCVETLSLYDGAYGVREDNKRDGVYPIQSAEEAAAIIGKIYGKETLMQYTQGLAQAYRNDPETAIDGLAANGILVDAKLFRSDQHSLDRAGKGHDISHDVLQSVAGEALREGAIDQAEQIRIQRDREEQEQIDAELKLQEMRRETERGPDYDDQVQRIKEEAEKLQKREEAKPTPARQQAIQAAIRRERAMRFYESKEGQSLLQSVQQKMAWVSARASGRTRPNADDRQLARDTVKELKAAHAYGRGQFASEIVRTKARAESRELAQNPAFQKRPSAQVFHAGKASEAQIARRSDTFYTRDQERLLRESVERRQRALAKDKDKKRD